MPETEAPKTFSAETSAFASAKAQSLGLGR